LQTANRNLEDEVLTMKSKKLLVITALLVMSLLLVGCTPKAAAPTAVPVATAAVTEASATTVPATEAPATAAPSTAAPATAVPAATEVTGLELTLEQLKAFNGKNGARAYIAVDGVIYDVTDISFWKNGDHKGYEAGKDLTVEIKTIAPHGIGQLVNAKIVGKLIVK
jgi:predicted heme/steroid binding protein